MFILNESNLFVKHRVVEDEAPHVLYVGAAAVAFAHCVAALLGVFVQDEFTGRNLGERAVGEHQILERMVFGREYLDSAEAAGVDIGEADVADALEQHIFRRDIHMYWALVDVVHDDV